MNVEEEIKKLQDRQLEQLNLLDKLSAVLSNHVEITRRLEIEMIERKKTL